jgi:hypothetical protein
VCIMYAEHTSSVDPPPPLMLSKSVSGQIDSHDFPIICILCREYIIIVMLGRLGSSFSLRTV